MEISVTLSANAGVAICTEQCRFWIDAIHEEKQPGFSAVTPMLQQKMLNHQAFQYPDHILFTHCHPDHYSRKLAKAAFEIWPNAKRYLPQQEFEDQILIAGQDCKLSDRHAISFLKLPHEGAQYAHVMHYGAILRLEGKNILIAGDCATASPVLAQALTGETIHLAILNFPWITLKKGREFIWKYLPQAKLLVHHIPFAEDDINGFREAAQKALAQFPEGKLLTEPLQTEIVTI